MKILSHIAQFDTPELVERKRVLHARGEMMRGHFHDAMRIYDLVILQSWQRFGGDNPVEVTGLNEEMRPWGTWIRDMKRAIDRSQGTPPALLPLPPLPSWFTMNPAIAQLCERLGVKV